MESGVEPKLGKRRKGKGEFAPRLKEFCSEWGQEHCLCCYESLLREVGAQADEARLWFDIRLDGNGRDTVNNIDNSYITVTLNQLPVLSVLVSSVSVSQCPL